eukprot:1147772-Pelagomonas_calceolata.AAC.4
MAASSSVLGVRDRHPGNHPLDGAPETVLRTLVRQMARVHPVLILHCVLHVCAPGAPRPCP